VAHREANVSHEQEEVEIVIVIVISGRKEELLDARNLVYERGEGMSGEISGNVDRPRERDPESLSRQFSPYLPFERQHEESRP